MLLHIFLQVICRRVVFALLGRLAGKNVAAFWAFLGHIFGRPAHGVFSFVQS